MKLVSIRGDHRYIIVVEWDKRDTANQFAAKWDPNPGGDETFGAVRLSADGTEPPTHTACNTLADGDMKTGIMNAMSNVPFVEVYDATEWTFAEVLADLGLQRIEPGLL